MAKSAGYALAACGLLVFAGCGGRKQDPALMESGPPVKDAAAQVEESGEPDPIARPEAKRGGSYTTWGGEYPKSLNLWLDYNTFSIEVMEKLFQPLVTLHSTKDEPVGILAESWDISPDKQSYTFKIHPQAKWSDGKPVTAEDVQFYYDVIMNPKNLTSLFRVDMSRFGRPEVIDQRTVKMTAKDSHWKNFWVAGEFVPLPKHVWEGKDFNAINFEFPVVNGPYALDEVKTNRSIRLKRRGDWWGRVRRYNAGKHNFDYLTYKAMTDRNKALESLKKGDFDLYPVYTAKIWAEQTDFPQVQKNWVLRQTIFNKAPIAFQGFAMNMRRPLFQDVRVRQALSHLLNRELMNEKLMFNQYFLLNSYYPDLYPGNRNPNAPTFTYDPEKARGLLREAGWQVDGTGTLVKDGKPFEFVFLHHGDDLRHLNIYVEDLKAVGLRPRIEVVSQATHTKRVDEHDFDMVWRNWQAVRLRDPETLWHSKTANEIATQNLCGVQDEEIDRLLALQREEMDLAKRNEIAKQIDARLTAIVPYVLIWQSDRQKLLYWNKFGTPPRVLDKFNHHDTIAVYWWSDPEKVDALRKARQNDTALAPAPAEVRYAE
ncbi:MAG: extracellular solute-binding protein [Verrucomicrobiota bacterium]|nr:extracellular solute-binding protein [Verrucomicrobiota bacterium]